MTETLKDPPFEAPTELVEPTKQLVEAAMRIVREGKVDGFGRQRVVLQHYGKLYQIIDVSVEETPDGVKSTGDQRTGLLVEVVIPDDTDSPVNGGFCIQTPRTSDAVTPEIIHNLRMFQPETITKLVKELTEATIFSSRID